jgi:hypothetical protein
VTRKIIRVLERRWRKEQQRTVPSPSTAFRYLKEFHDKEQEELRKLSEVKAFIPAPNEHLKGFSKVDQAVGAFRIKLWHYSQTICFFSLIVS